MLYDMIMICTVGLHGIKYLLHAGSLNHTVSNLKCQLGCHIVHNTDIGILIFYSLIQVLQRAHVHQ